ncbi:hypothetical protein AB0D32_08650 [Micromonospora sp. NPDC048170]|uniref:hypothetical protein n=1 Tax=Micromonospora sp. NPDC048170 TaxID=3154819 RepID=UPI0033C463E2
MVRDDDTAELLAFPHRDFFCGTGTYGELETTRNRPTKPSAPDAGATDLPAVS